MITGRSTKEKGSGPASASRFYTAHTGNHEKCAARRWKQGNLTQKYRSEMQESQFKNA